MGSSPMRVTQKEDTTSVASSFFCLGVSYVFLQDGDAADAGGDEAEGSEHQAIQHICFLNSHISSGGLWSPQQPAILTIIISSGGLRPPQQPAILTIIISVRLGAAEAGDLRYYRVLQSSYSVRRPIGFRSQSNQIPNAVRLDSERRPIGFRTPPDRIPYATRSDSVRYTMTFREQKDESACGSDRLVEVV